MFGLSIADLILAVFLIAGIVLIFWLRRS